MASHGFRIRTVTAFVGLPDDEAGLDVVVADATAFLGIAAKAFRDAGAQRQLARSWVAGCSREPSRG
jgi:hypothetical protein